MSSKGTKWHAFIRERSFGPQPSEFLLERGGSSPLPHTGVSLNTEVSPEELSIDVAMDLILTDDVGTGGCWNTVFANKILLAAEMGLANTDPNRLAIEIEFLRLEGREPERMKTRMRERIQTQAALVTKTDIAPGSIMLRGVGPIVGPVSHARRNVPLYELFQLARSSDCAHRAEDNHENDSQGWRLWCPDHFSLNSRRLGDEVEVTLSGIVRRKQLGSDGQESLEYGVIHPRSATAMSNVCDSMVKSSGFFLDVYAHENTLRDLNEALSKSKNFWPVKSIALDEATGAHELVSVDNRGAKDTNRPRFSLKLLVPKNSWNEGQTE